MDTLRLPSSLIPPSTDRRTPEVGQPESPWIAPALRARSAEAAWDSLLVCVAIYILTAVGRVHQLYPVLQIVHPALVAGVLSIVLYLMDGRESRRLSRVWQPTAMWLVALLVWVVLSVPGAINVGNSFALLIDNFIKTVVMFFVIAGAVRGVRDVERLAFAYYIAAVIYAAVVLARFSLGSGDAWRLGDLYYYDANDFATFAVTAMPFGLYFAHMAKRPWTRAFAVMALMILAATFVRSGSRGGFLALLVMGGYVVLRYTAIPARWRVSASVLVAVVVIGTASGEYWTQMGTIVSDSDYNQTEESGRLQIWQRGITYMLDHPLLGVGADDFNTAEGTLSPMASRQQYGIGVRWNTAHNSYILAGAELGIPGLVFFVGMIVSAFRALRGPTRRRGQPVVQEGRELRQAVTASLIGFVVGAFFLSLTYHEMLYTLIAFAVGLGKLAQLRATAPRRVVQ